MDSPGYVLKPISLRQKTVERVEQYRVRVRIISAQRLPLSSDILVEASIGSINRKTSSMKAPTINPLWNETLEITITTTPSLLGLTFLRLEIRNRALLAQWMRPLSMAPRGYHHLPLHDSLFSRYVFATLFVRIDVDILHDDTP